MPMYEYVCEKCSHKFEILVRTSDEKLACPSCKSEKLRKLFSIFGLSLGGSGGGGGG